MEFLGCPLVTQLFIKLIVSVRIILIEPHLTVCQDGLCLTITGV